MILNLLYFLIWQGWSDACLRPKALTPCELTANVTLGVWVALREPLSEHSRLHTWKDYNMSENKGKSLRTNRRKTARPAISAPKQISGPIPQTGNVQRPGQPSQPQSLQPPRPPLASGKVLLLLESSSTLADLSRHLILWNEDILHALTTYLPTSTQQFRQFHLYLRFLPNMPHPKIKDVAPCQQNP